MKLYSYFRSSASFRVRIALALKGLEADYVPVHLVRNEQLAPAYTSLNPARQVPLLEHDGHTLAQSLAIVEYLDEVHPLPPLLPADPAGRARVRGLALDIACEVHPLNNLRVLRYLNRTLQLDEAARNAWYRHWVEEGLAAVEAQLAASPHTGRFCHGDTPGLADLVLVPQIFNARRMDCPLLAFPTVMRITEHCMALDAFASAQPSACPDADA